MLQPPLLTALPTRIAAFSLAVGALLGVFGAGPLCWAKAAKPSRKQKIQALRSRLSALKHKKQQQRAVLHETKKTQVRLADRLNHTYEQLDDANQALKESEQRLRVAEAAVVRANAELHAAEERLLAQQRRFGKRISYYYREGSVSYANVLLGSRDISDFLDRKYYVGRLMNQDATLMRELRDAQREVARERQQLVERRSALAAAHQAKATWVAQVSARTGDLERLLNEIRKQRALEEQRLQELDEDSNEIQKSLEEELARRLANPQAYRNLPKWSGKFGAPSRGRITSGFGYRYHPILHYSRLHAGVDFAGPIGSPVFAAAEGEVFFASWRGGYGRCIILLHGGGVSTLYGHLSRIDIRSGQTVHRGQLIGAVGTTGLSTGPHLHFEVRRNGVPVNPM